MEAHVDRGESGRWVPGRTANQAGHPEHPETNFEGTRMQVNPLVQPTTEQVQTDAIVLPRKPRRNHRSAKKAGALFEQQTADYIAERLDDDRIERRVMGGVNDRGDISNVRTLQGARVVVECKNVSTMSLGSWVDEAEIERGNDDALVGVVVHKRRGIGDPGQQFVTMTLDTLVTLLDGGIDR